MIKSSDAAACPGDDDIMNEMCEQACVVLETRSRQPEAGAGAALPKPAVRTSDVGELARAIHRQAEAFEARAAGQQDAQKRQAPAATEARRKLHDIRMRIDNAFKVAVDKRDDDRRRGRHDPINDVTIDRTGAALEHAERRELDELRAARRRPAGPSDRRAAGGRVARGSDLDIARRATMSYLRTGQEMFNGLHLRDIQRRAFEERALQSQIGSDGGYLVHPEHDTGPIERLLLDLTPMRELATVRTISAASLKKPFNVGGASASWVGEIEERPETATPSVVELEFPAMELYAKPLASQTLLEDAAIDIEAWLADEVALAFAEKETVAYISGDGVKKPMGFLAYAKVANASWAWGSVGYIATGADGAFSAASTTASPYDKLLDVAYSMKQTMRQNATWMMNRTTISKVRQIKDPEGAFVFKPMGRDGEPAELIGYGVHEGEQMPDIGAGSYSIAFGDWKRAYVIVDRIGLSVLRDPYTAHPHVAFKTRKRVGGGIQNFEALKLLKFAAS